MHIDFEPASNELQIRSNRTELVDIVRSLLVDKTIINCPIAELKAEYPFSSYLGSIRIVHRVGQPVKISVIDNKQLEISGSLESMNMLAENIEGLSKHPQWEHLHLEYYPEHPYLSDSTLPLIFHVMVNEEK